MHEKIRKHIIDLAQQHEDKPITLCEWKELRMNSWEREYLFKFVDNDTIKRIAAESIDNCSRMACYDVATTYDEFVIHRLVPELLRRLDAQ